MNVNLQNNSIFGFKQVFLSLHLLFFIEKGGESANDEGKNHDKVIKQLKVNFKALGGAKWKFLISLSYIFYLRGVARNETSNKDFEKSYNLFK